MKYLVFAVLIICIIISCENSDSKPLFLNQLKQKDEIYSINKGLKVHVLPGENGVLLEIQEGKKRAMLDTIQAEIKIENIELADWNFDGFNDLFVLDKISSGSGGNVYIVWLFAHSGDIVPPIPEHMVPLFHDVIRVKLVNNLSF